MKFEELLAINVNDHTENKNGLTYLSWTWAWSEIKKICPNATYVIKKFENNLPYVYDENTGYMVFTEMTIGNETYEMWLPVMDGNNKAMLNHPYTYKVKEYVDGTFTGKYKEKIVEAATMFDVNKTIMRCLVKNIAMFGLGLYIYAGEDMPEGYEISKEEAEKVICPFKKHLGETLKEVKEKDPQYLHWIINFEGSKQSLKEACSKLVSPITEESLQLMNEFNELILKTNTDPDKIYERLKVKNNAEMTDEQFKKAINFLKGLIKK